MRKLFWLLEYKKFKCNFPEDNEYRTSGESLDAAPTDFDSAKIEGQKKWDKIKEENKNGCWKVSSPRIILVGTDIQE